MNDYLFVADIHGWNDELTEKLSKIADGNELPKIVFFLGDIVGTKLLDQFQKLFYNQVYNPMKALLKNNPFPSNEEILSYQVSDGQSLCTGCVKLWEFLHELYPEYNSLNAAAFARKIVSYAHFGHFCSSLPPALRAIFRQDMEKNAKAIIDIMTKFTDKGVLVVVIEGNWDARTPLDFCPTEDLRVIPVKNRSFYFKKLLSTFNPQVLYVNHVSTISTENEIFVLWPFDCAVTPTRVPEFSDEENRKIILVSHAQIDWKPIKGDTPMTKEGENIQENMSEVFRDLQADLAVHGHLHDQIDADGYIYKQKYIYYLPIHTCRFINF